MVSNCAFLLANGRPCRCPALHDENYCRHHTPAALARRRARLLREDDSTTPPDSTPDLDQLAAPIPPAYLRAYWRTHHRIIAHADAETCTEIYDMILYALSERGISPRSGGRLLQAVFDRRRVLVAEAEQAAFRALEEKARRIQAAHAAPNSATASARPPMDPRSLPIDESFLSPHTLEALTSALSSPAPGTLPATPPFGASEMYRVSR